MSRKWVIVLLFLAGFLIAATRSDLTGDTYTISQANIAGGGGRLAGVEFDLVGSAGQPEAGKTLIGQEYSVAGGFFAAGSLWRSLFLPLISR